MLPDKIEYDVARADYNTTYWFVSYYHPCGIDTIIPQQIKRITKKFIYFKNSKLAKSHLNYKQYENFCGIFRTEYECHAFIANILKDKIEEARQVIDDFNNICNCYPELII